MAHTGQQHLGSSVNTEGFVVDMYACEWVWQGTTPHWDHPHVIDCDLPKCLNGRVHKLPGPKA